MSITITKEQLLENLLKYGKCYGPFEVGKPAPFDDPRQQQRRDFCEWMVLQQLAYEAYETGKQKWEDIIKFLTETNDLFNARLEDALKDRQG